MGETVNWLMVRRDRWGRKRNYIGNNSERRDTDKGKNKTGRRGRIRNQQVKMKHNVEEKERTTRKKQNETKDLRKKRRYVKDERKETC